MTRFDFFIKPSSTVHDEDMNHRRLRRAEFEA